MGEKLCKEVLEIKKEKRYMIYFHWIYLLLYVVITVPAIITVLMDNRQDDGMDIGLFLHPLCGYYLLFLLRTEYPQGTAYQRPQHGPAHQALHARVRRAGESSPARQQ